VHPAITCGFGKRRRSEAQTEPGPSKGTAKMEGIMDDPYPPEMPRAARARVKAKDIIAAREFEQGKQSLRSSGEIEAALRRYIMQVFLAFAEEALELGRQGIWSVHQIEWSHATSCFGPRPKPRRRRDLTARGTRCAV